jgi:hypothetical protein
MEKQALLLAVAVPYLAVGLFPTVMPNPMTGSCGFMVLASMRRIKPLIQLM